MRNVVAISLTDDLLKRLTAEAKEENTSRSEIIRGSLKQYFFTRDFTKLRNRAMGELAKKGITLTEEQIFNEIS